MNNERNKRILVIAYGNPYRNDDGVAHYIAESVQEWANEEKISKITIITTYQLDIDMAEDISEADNVYFLDAHITDYSPNVVIEKVEPKKTNGFTTHVFTPSDLIALAEQLYGKSARGMLISVPGHNFDMGEELTNDTRKQADYAAKKLKEMIMKKV